MLFIRWHSIITLHGFLKQTVRKFKQVIIQGYLGKVLFKKEILDIVYSRQIYTFLSTVDSSSLLKPVHFQETCWIKKLYICAITNQSDELRLE
jgi:hypothetical protein